MRAIKNERLGQFIREARLAKGLTQRQLGELSDIDYTGIARLERGEFESPSPLRLQRLARALDIDAEDIYALAGYLMPEGLPTLGPYLRAKYDLPEPAAGDVERYVQTLRKRYGEEGAQKNKASGKRGGRAKRGR